jgi:tripartite ATP-independent transporter DctP family solute receptor
MTLTTRRTLLAGSAMLLAGRAAAQPATTLKIYTMGYDPEVAMIAAEVPRRTGGRYRIEQIVGLDQVEAALGKERAAGGDRALLEGIRNGDLDLVVTSALLLGDYVPQARVFSVPFLFRDYAHARAVLDGPIGQDVLAQLAAHGLVGFAWAEDGFRHLANGKRPIRTPEDLTGLKLRAQENPVVIETFRALGGEAVPMSFGKAFFDALAQGILDGADITIGAAVNFEPLRSLKYLSLTGHSYTPAVVVMSTAAYDRLSEGDRQAFVEAGRLAGQVSREDVDHIENHGLAQLLGVGMKINTDVDKAAFQAALAPAYAKWREQFGDLIDRIQAYR